MKLTTELLANYIGGQVEIQGKDQPYYYRGEIATAVVEGVDIDAVLKVTLAWMAKGVGNPPALASRLVEDTDRTYNVSLYHSSISDIGDDRLLIQSPYVDDVVVFYPPTGSRLDPSKVEGLNIG